MDSDRRLHWTLIVQNEMRKNLNSWWKVDYVVIIFNAPPLLSEGDLLILPRISLQLNVVFILPLVEKKKTVLCTLTFRIQT